LRYRRRSPSIAVHTYEKLTRSPRKTPCTEKFQMTFNLLEGTIPTEMGRLTNLGAFEYRTYVTFWHATGTKLIDPYYSFSRQLYSELVVIR
jgi:hypothetical protein